MFKHTIFSIKSLPVGWTQTLDLAMMMQVIYNSPRIQTTLRQYL
jgi:hypothetical protein